MKRKTAGILIGFICLLVPLCCYSVDSFQSDKKVSDFYNNYSSNSSNGIESNTSSQFVNNPQAVTFSGNSDDVVSISESFVPAVIHASYSGDDNFIIKSLDANKGYVDLIVNTIDCSNGYMPINFMQGETVSYFEIIADGSWSITATQLSRSALHNLQHNSYSGTGDDMLLIEEPYFKATFHHSGDSNFIVVAYANSRELMVNEIGQYDGTAIVPNDTQIINVQAEDAWSVVFEE